MAASHGGPYLADLWQSSASQHGGRPTGGHHHLTLAFLGEVAVAPELPSCAPWPGPPADGFSPHGRIAYWAKNHVLGRLPRNAGELTDFQSRLQTALGRVAIGRTRPPVYAACHPGTQDAGTRRETPPSCHRFAQRPGTAPASFWYNRCSAGGPDYRVIDTFPLPAACARRLKRLTGSGVSDEPADRPGVGQQVELAIVQAGDAVHDGEAGGRFRSQLVRAASVAGEGRFRRSISPSGMPGRSRRPRCGIFAGRRAAAG